MGTTAQNENHKRFKKLRYAGTDFMEKRLAK